MHLSKQETCQFVAATAAQLATLANAADLITLVYLLEMARLEAETEIRLQQELAKAA